MVSIMMDIGYVLNSQGVVDRAIEPVAVIVVVVVAVRLQNVHNIVF